MNLAVQYQFLSTTTYFEVTFLIRLLLLILNLTLLLINRALLLLRHILYYMVFELILLALFRVAQWKS